MLLSLAAPLAAEEGGEKPSVILIHADDEVEVEVTDANNMPMAAYVGMELAEGESIRTYGTTIELELKPNGSMLKLDAHSWLKVEGFQRNINSANDFTLIGGKLRVVAAQRGKKAENYNFFTKTAICGVRGTDFLIDDGGRLVVADGIVELIKKSTGETMEVSAGMAADTSKRVFQAAILAEQEISEEFRDFRFEVLDPENVPHRSLEEETSTAPEAEPKVEVTKAVPAVPFAGALPSGGGEKAKTSENSRGLGGLLGMEIGSFTLDQKFYSRILLQPTFSIGSFQAALYLPIIYEENIFSPQDWYRPGGNNEWSFGSDQVGAWNIVSDAARDLLLKIRYLKWGEQGDLFFLKFGNLNDITLGNGILMLNYANDTDFPAVRKVGINLGINTEKFTLEMMGDDLANPQIFGLRLGFRPFGGFPLGFGLSGITDLNPAKDFDNDSKLIFFNPAFDLDFPIIKNDSLSLVLFGGLAAMMPVMNDKLYLLHFYNDEEKALLDRFRNYGFAAGLLGSIFFFDYRIEYQQSVGKFRPSFYNSAYDRKKREYAEETIQFLTYPSSVETVRGIHASFGMNIANVFNLSGGYLAPWTDGGFSSGDDYAHLEMSLTPNPLPLKLSFIYNRMGLVENITKGFDFIDASTLLKGEVVYSVSPSLDIALLLSSAMKRGVEGTLVLDDSGEPEYSYTFTIDARVHF